MQNTKTTKTSGSQSSTAIFVGAGLFIAALMSVVALATLI